MNLCRCDTLPRATGRADADTLIILGDVYEEDKQGGCLSGQLGKAFYSIANSHGLNATDFYVVSGAIEYIPAPTATNAVHSDGTSCKDYYKSWLTNALIPYFRHIVLVGSAIEAFCGYKQNKVNGMVIHQSDISDDIPVLFMRNPALLFTAGQGELDFAMKNLAKLMKGETYG